MTADIIMYDDIDADGKVAKFYKLNTGIFYKSTTIVKIVRFDCYSDAVTFLRYLNGAPIDARIEAMLNKYNL